MKPILFAAIAGLALAGCDDKPAAPKTNPTPSKPAATPPATNPPAAAPSAGAPTGNLLDAAKEKANAAAATELRDKAVAALSSKYDEFKMQIATLQDKAKDVPAVAKAAFDTAITQLNTLTKDVESKLVELKNASGDAVKTLQTSIEGAWPKIQEHLATAEKALKGG